MHEDLGLHSHALKNGQLLIDEIHQSQKVKATASLNEMKHELNDSAASFDSSQTRITLIWTRKSTAEYIVGSIH